jgi:hypothetical protein
VGRQVQGHAQLCEVTVHAVSEVCRVTAGPPGKQSGWHTSLQCAVLRPEPMLSACCCPLQATTCSMYCLNPYCNPIL